MTEILQSSIRLVLLLLLLASQTFAQTQPSETRPLLPDRPIGRELKGGEAHSYSLGLDSGQFLYLIVDQRGIDVVVTVYGPDGKKLSEVDSPNFWQGLEPVSMIVDTKGSYTVEVRSPDEKAVPGRYEISVVEWRSATERDKGRVAIEQQFSHAQRLQAEGTEQSMHSAIQIYEQALPLLRAVGDSYREALTLYYIGRIASDLGQFKKALDYFAQTLPFTRAAGYQFGEAEVLNNIGQIYSSLGEQEKALEYYAQALPLQRAVGDRNGEASTLNNLGAIHYVRGEKQKALDYYQKALALMRAVGDRQGEAITLNNIGAVYDTSGENQNALEWYGKALLVIRAIEDRGAEANTLHNIALVHYHAGEKQKALDYYSQSLPLNRAIGNRDGEARTLNSLSYLYESLGNPRLATFYSKLAANAFQQLRSHAQGLDRDVQKTYLKSVERIYRRLTDLLLAQGRSTEAQQVLNTFKDEQFFDFDREGILNPLTHTPRELELARHYERERFSAFLKQAENEFSRPADAKDKVGEIPDTAELQATLRQLDKETGGRTVAVYTLRGENRYYGLLVTADSLTSVFAPIKGSELDAKALRLWGLLQSDDYDPTPLSHELYNLIFKPIEHKLPPSTKTIIWSLDGNLRYVPVAALYDGKRYLVERYSHVNFTRVDQKRLTRAVTRSWTATGLGTSAAHTVELLDDKISFDDLPGVGEELRLLFKQSDNPSGIFDGETLQDEKFTKPAMLSALKEKRPLVHIASHFAFRPGDAERSFLLVGDGTAFTLAEMKQQVRLFEGVEMLTLSACNTAAQQAGATGREIDAFAEVAQRLGANSVMATLWPVADGSTPWLMREFYQTRQTRTLNKAEALRQAQLSLLQGKASATPIPAARKRMPMVQVLGDGAVKTSANTRADVLFVESKNARPFKKDPRKPFAHPYYWSPFVLFGNWK